MVRCAAIEFITFKIIRLLQHDGHVISLGFNVISVYVVERVDDFFEEADMSFLGAFLGRKYPLTRVCNSSTCTIRVLIHMQRILRLHAKHKGKEQKQYT